MTMTSYCAFTEATLNEIVTNNCQDESSLTTRSPSLIQLQRDIPMDTTVSILSYLDLISLHSIANTNRYWKNLIYGCCCCSSSSSQNSATRNVVVDGYDQINNNHSSVNDNSKNDVDCHENLAPIPVATSKIMEGINFGVWLPHYQRKWPDVFNKFSIGNSSGTKTNRNVQNSKEQSWTNNLVVTNKEFFSDWCYVAASSTTTTSTSSSLSTPSTADDDDDDYTTGNNSSLPLMMMNHFAILSLASSYKHIPTFVNVDMMIETIMWYTPTTRNHPNNMYYNYIGDDPLIDFYFGRIRQLGFRRSYNLPSLQNDRIRSATSHTYTTNAASRINGSKSGATPPITSAERNRMLHEFVLHNTKHSHDVLRNTSNTTPLVLQFVDVRINISSRNNLGNSDQKFIVVTGIQYTGIVGNGDRCIRANYPLPRPTCMNHSSHHRTSTKRCSRGRVLRSTTKVLETAAANLASFVVPTSFQQQTRQRRRMIRQRQDTTTPIGVPTSTNASNDYSEVYSNTEDIQNSIDSTSRNRRISNITTSTSCSDSISSFSVSSSPCYWRPFVAPYCVQQTNMDGTTATMLDVTPRLISYFEVSIHDPKSSVQYNNEMLQQPHSSSWIANGITDANHRHERFQYNHPLLHRTSCVAVGVATAEFNGHNRMPGWDRSSIGYHGDDGNLFFGSGTMARTIGPTFGVGDTIGCGIDYYGSNPTEPSPHITVFFTLNGKLIGTETIYCNNNTNHSFMTQDLYPVVGIDTNDIVTMNFGTVPEIPFSFNLQGLVSSNIDRI